MLPSIATILFNNSCLRNFIECNMFFFRYLLYLHSLQFNLFISAFNPSMSLNLLVQPNPSNPIITQTKHFNLVAFLDSCLWVMTCRSRLTDDVYCCIFFPRILVENFMPHSSRL